MPSDQPTDQPTGPTVSGDDQPTPAPIDPRRSPERRRIQALAKQYRDEYRHRHTSDD